ncbi:MAG: sugar ABC transporter substrate-binding protein, partial [Halanaerobiaceae bacterium]
MSFKKGFILVMVGVLVLGYSLSIGASEEISKDITIGWCPPDTTGVFATATDYFEKAAEDARDSGIEVEIVTQSPTSHEEFTEQSGIIEDFIARNVDVIVVSPSEVDVVKPSLMQANREGIPVIVVNLLDPIEDVEVESYIGFSNYDAARIAGFATVDYLGGPGVLGEDVVDDPPEDLDLDFWEELYSDVEPEEIEMGEKKVAILEGIAGGFFSRQRLDGFHSVIDEYDNIDIVASRAADWNREKGVNETEDILQEYGDELDVIYAASNEMGIGAVHA